MRVKIDASAVTVVPICECGWRGLPSRDRSAALHEARHHEMRAHPGDRAVARQLDQHHRRHAAES